jgi:hypothetical protein
MNAYDSGIWGFFSHKNQENRRQSQTCLSYAEVHPVFDKVKTTASRKTFAAVSHIYILPNTCHLRLFSLFFCKIILESSDP